MKMKLKRNTKRQNIRRSNTTIKKRKGGNVDPNTKNEDITCNLLDTKLNTKSNQLWRTCITANYKKHDIFYFTPTNVVIKSIETAQIPELFVKTGDFEGKCKIKIEDKYVACFLLIDDRWYAMMRLFGTTLNTGIIARTEKNKAFYLLDKEVMNPPSDRNLFGLIVLDPSYTQLPVNESTWFSTSSNSTIVIDKGFTQITKENALETFNILQNFRNQKVIGNAIKYKVATDVVSSVFDLLKFSLGS